MENINNQFIFYKQTFPKLDNDIIRLVLEEVEADNVLNVFLELTSELTDEENLSYLKFLEPPPVLDNNVPSTNHNQSVERSSNLNDNIFGQDNSTSYQPPGFLSRLFGRNSSYNVAKYERDDDL